MFCWVPKLDLLPTTNAPPPEMCKNLHAQNNFACLRRTVASIDRTLVHGLPKAKSMNDQTSSNPLNREPTRASFPVLKNKAATLAVLP